MHCSYEAGILEDPDHTPPKELWTRTVDPLNAPDKPTDFAIQFEQGLPVKVILSGGKEITGSVAVFKALNQLGYENGVGRIDVSIKILPVILLTKIDVQIVENRFSQYRKQEKKAFSYTNFAVASRP